MDMDCKSVILFLSVIQGIAAIRILNNFYEIPTLHEDTDEERAIVELKTEMHWSIGWLHGVYCEIKDNEYSDLFFIDGKTVKKHACSSPGCGPTCYAKGCLSFLRQSDYVLKIRCDQSLFNVRPFITDHDTAEMRISISKNQEPEVFIDPVGDVSLLASEAYANGIIARVSYTDVESDAVTLTCTGSDNFRLFQKSTSGSIVIEKDLQNEKSRTFTVNISAMDRRNTVTQVLKIRLIGTTTTTTMTTASTIRVTEELITQPPSIEVPILTASTSRVTEELVTPPPLIEVPNLTDGNPTDTLSTTTVSTNRLTDTLITTPMSMKVSVPSDWKPTNPVVTSGIAPSYSYNNIWTVTSTTTEREKGDRIPPSKDIHNPVLYIIVPLAGDRIPPSKDIHNTVLYIVIPLAVLAIIAVSAIIIVWIKRHPIINGYRKLKENANDLEEAQEAGFDNPTYFMITSQKT